MVEYLDIIVGFLHEKYTLFAAIAGATDLKLINGNRPNLILPDIMMLVVDEFEVLKVLKNDKKISRSQLFFYDRSQNRLRIIEN